MHPYPSLRRLPLWVRWILLAIGIVALLKTSMRVGSQAPSGSIPFDIEFTYNIGHQFLYGYFALAILLLLTPAAPSKIITWIWLPCLVFALGVLDEWNQSFRFRGSGMNDVGSDVLGCMHILILAFWFSAKRKPRHTALLLSAQVLIGVSWNLVVIYAPDPPLPLLGS